MTIEHQIDFMSSSYSLKYEEVLKQEQNSKCKTTHFEDTVYEVIKNRYGVKKKVKQKCEEFLIGIRTRTIADERVDDFKKFMGFENPKYSNEVLVLYNNHLQSTELGFQTLLGEEAENESIELRSAYNKASDVFANAPSSLRQEILKSMIYEGIFYMTSDDHSKPERKDSFSDQERFSYFIL